MSAQLPAASVTSTHLLQSVGWPGCTWPGGVFGAWGRATAKAAEVVKRREVRRILILVEVGLEE